MAKGLRCQSPEAPTDLGLFVAGPGEAVYEEGVGAGGPQMPGNPQGQGRGAVLLAQGQKGDQGRSREEGRPQLGHIVL